MNERKFLSLFALILSILLAGCSPSEEEAPPLAGAAIGGGYRGMAVAAVAQGLVAAALALPLLGRPRAPAAEISA